ncbi:MAG TPA: hypothetical protein VGO52_00450 [Hyphomonadaceae bacterium]|jgi:hypothetical protein|nr:hypothetical protein [Hyphomonadaceae bacterium]
MKDDWGEFFFLIGSSAAGLIGLIFVVATLTSDLDKRRAIRGMRVYMTPNVFHFAVVLTLCALACSPQIKPPVLAGAMAAAALIGIVYVGQRALGLARPGMAVHWSDYLYYGAAPLIGYVALGFDAWAIGSAAPYADTLAAGLMLGFLLLGIRNAWDLVSYMAPRAGRSDAQGADAETNSSEAPDGGSTSEDARSPAVH